MKNRIERAGHFLFRNRGKIAKALLFVAGLIHAFDAHSGPPRPVLMARRPPKK